MPTRFPLWTVSSASRQRTGRSVCLLPSALCTAQVPWRGERSAGVAVFVFLLCEILFPLLKSFSNQIEQNHYVFACTIAHWLWQRQHEQSGEWVEPLPLESDCSKLKLCPDCRAPVSGVSRYNRITNKAKVATKSWFGKTSVHAFLLEVRRQRVMSRL